ncbi:MAG: class I SAM-dependent methyltransferase [Actinomycetota bacterium]|nr:class I SAM-dependent methyltransferase [Actinomycetota bacterium]
MTATVTDSDGHSFRLEPIDCPICGPGPKKRLGLRGGRSHRYGLGVETTIVVCRSCGLLFPDPFPYPLNPQKLYGDPAKYFEHHDEAGHIANHEAIVAGIAARSHVAAPVIVDVGSGRGELLAAAKKAGLDAVGLELSTTFIGYARDRHGVEVLRETIEEHSLSYPTRYDAVAFSAVLEHLYDPAAAIAAAARLSRPGAVLYLDLPCEPNLLTRVHRVGARLSRSDAVLNLSPTFTPYHVFGFNPASLERLLAQHGFVIEDCRIWAAPAVPSRGGLDAVRAAAATTLNRLANHIGQGSNMVVWARWDGRS